MESLKKPIKKLFASLSALSLILALTLTATASGGGRGGVPGGGGPLKIS